MMCYDCPTASSHGCAALALFEFLEFWVSRNISLVEPFGWDEA